MALLELILNPFTGLVSVGFYLTMLALFIIYKIEKRG